MAFWAESAPRILLRSSKKQVILCGLVAHICVFSNAILAKAALPEARIAVAADLTLSPDPADKERALASLTGVQVDVI